MVQYPCVSCLGKYAGAAYGNVPIFSGGDPAVSLFTGTVALGREADSPAGETEVRAKEEKSGWSGEKSPGRKAAGFLLVFRAAAGGGDSIFSVCGLLRDQLLPNLLFGKLGDRGGGIYGRGAYRGLPVADG